MGHGRWQAIASSPEPFAGDILLRLELSKIWLGATSRVSPLIKGDSRGFVQLDSTPNPLLTKEARKSSPVPHSKLDQGVFVIDGLPVSARGNAHHVAAEIRLFQLTQADKMQWHLIFQLDL